MAVWVSLLRAVNLGKTQRVKNAELVRVYESIGLKDVVAWLQSGNVIYRGPKAGGRIEKALKDELGLDTTVFLRSPGEMREILENNPYEGNPSRIHVGYLDGTPEVDLEGPPGDDVFTVRGDVVYLHLPNGAARTKLTTAFFEKGLGCRMTMRNLRVSQGLLEKSLA